MVNNKIQYLKYIDYCMIAADRSIVHAFNNKALLKGFSFAEIQTLHSIIYADLEIANIYCVIILNDLHQYYKDNWVDIRSRAIPFIEYSPHEDYKKLMEK